MFFGTRYLEALRRGDDGKSRTRSLAKSSRFRSKLKEITKLPISYR